MKFSEKKEYSWYYTVRILIDEFRKIERGMNVLEKTEFTENTIVEEVKKNYGLNVTEVEKLNRGSANLFKLTANNKFYILKEFQSKHQEKSIMKEINVINFLKEKGLIVPKYIQCINKEYYFRHNDKIVIMQEYIEGEVKEKNTGNKEQLLDSAKYLGLIVDTLKDYPYEDMFKCNMNKYASDEVLQRSIDQNLELIEKAKSDKLHGNKIVENLTDKINMLNQLLKDVTFKDITNVTVRKTHGDYSVMQFIYDGDKIKAIIDFVDAAELPITWEIIRSYSYIDKECINGNFNIDNLVEYTKEYMKYSSLNKYDLEYMPYVYLVQLLNSTYGYKQYLNDGNLELLKFGEERTNICRYLMENAKIISEKLLEIEI